MTTKTFQVAFTKRYKLPTRKNLLKYLDLIFGILFLLALVKQLLE